MRRIIAFLFLLAAPLWSQTSQSIDASETVVVAPMLTLSKSQDITWGTHFAQEGDVFSSTTNYAAWLGQTDVGNHLSVVVSAPLALNKQGGTGSVPVSYGATSAEITNDIIVNRFNPATGIPNFGPVGSPGTFTITLGKGATAADQVTVHLSNAQRGTYSGLITLTVTVL